MQWVVNDTYYLQGQRRNSVIFHCNDGFFYHKHEVRNYGIHLRCVRWKRTVNPCPGRAFVSNNGAVFRVTNRHEGHLPDFHFSEEKRLRYLILQEVAAGNPSRFKAIINNVGLRGGFSVDVRSRLPLERLRETMRCTRMINLPPIPWNLALLGGFLTMPQFAHVTATFDNQDNIFAGVCGVYASGTLSVVFISRRLQMFMQQSRKIFADGTFKRRCKKPACSQIFTISTTWEHPGTRRKHIITLARVLMQRRTTEAYTTLFNFLKNLMPAWSPNSIMCDHELAQVNAWSLAFPNATLMTCLWHFAVDVFRYAKKLGLKPYMDDLDEMATVIRACAALPLLPGNRLEEGILALGIWARLLGLMRLPILREMFHYLYTQWVPAQNYLSVANAEDRTNNVSESVNFTIGLEVRVTRPNVWDLLHAFKRLDDQSIVDLVALENGVNVSRSQTLQTLRNDHRIANLTNSLNLGRINIIQFLVRASHTLQAPFDFIYDEAEHNGDLEEE